MQPLHPRAAQLCPKAWAAWIPGKQHISEETKGIILHDSTDVAPREANLRNLVFRTRGSGPFKDLCVVPPSEQILWPAVSFVHLCNTE
jgi:hypothetical protein